MVVHSILIAFGRLEVDLKQMFIINLDSSIGPALMLAVLCEPTRIGQLLGKRICN